MSRQVILAGLGLLLILIMAGIAVLNQPATVAGPDMARLTNAGRLKLALLKLIVRMLEAVTARFGRYPRAGAATVERHVVPTSFGPARIDMYRPATMAGSRLPVHFHLHGGGFVVGGLKADAPWCNYLSNQAGCVVINIDYVLAPRDTFPAPVMQSHEVIEWVACHADDLGIDPERLSVGGESAGANLSIAVALLALERQSFGLRGVVACVPVLDLDSDPHTKSISTERKQDLTVATMEQVNDVYLPKYLDRRNPLASPIFSNQLAKLPEVFIVSAELDAAYSDAAAFDARLRKENARFRHLTIRGADHLFLHKGRFEHVVKAWEAMAGAVKQVQQGGG
ncbi:alpha/beta hydrolase [Massilia sp. METH4]|uniref:alpha/beta hydrolase n=1 Tax=Massilia sp. METH4 TaxID=3123041 RepID=UPI0030D06908